MKKIFFAMIATAALASCSQDEVMNINQEAIGFGNAVVDNVPRVAVDPSYGTSNPLTAFKVWGTVQGSSNAVSIYEGATVEGSVDTGNVWIAQNVATQYWIEGANYNFVAVVNGTTVNAVTNALPTSIEYTANGSNDLLYARSQEYVGLASNNPLVKFEFAHLLAKVKFNLANNTPVGTVQAPISTYTYTLTDIKISNAITKGTYTINDVWDATKNKYTPNGTWTEKESKGQEFDNINNVTNGTNADCAEEKLIVPMEDAQISCNVNLYYGGKLISTVNKSEVVDLVAGHSYSVNVTAGLNEPIQFTVESNPTWE